MTPNQMIAWIVMKLFSLDKKIARRTLQLERAIFNSSNKSKQRNSKEREDSLEEQGRSKNVQGEDIKQNSGNGKKDV